MLSWLGGDALAEVAERGGRSLHHPVAAASARRPFSSVAVGDARNRGYKVLTVRGLESEADLPFAGLHSSCSPPYPGRRASRSQKNALLTGTGNARGSGRPKCFLVGLATLSLMARSATKGLWSWL